MKHDFVVFQICSQPKQKKNKKKKEKKKEKKRKEKGDSRLIKYPEVGTQWQNSKLTR